MAKTASAPRKRKHAKERALERYGVQLTRVDIAKIVDLIGKGTGEAKFISRTSNDRTVWEVSYQGTTFKVVYSKRHRTLVTVLPLVDNWEVNS